MKHALHMCRSVMLQASLKAEKVSEVTLMSCCRSLQAEVLRGGSGWGEEMVQSTLGVCDYVLDSSSHEKYLK